MADHTPDGVRMVSLSLGSEEVSTQQQVQALHSALRQCLGLLHCVIVKEEEEWGELQGDYETLRKNVRSRLVNLLHTTKSLAETEDTTLEVTPDHQCNEVEDMMIFLFLYISDTCAPHKSSKHEQVYIWDTLFGNS